MEGNATMKCRSDDGLGWDGRETENIKSGYGRTSGILRQASRSVLPRETFETNKLRGGRLLIPVGRTCSAQTTGPVAT